MGLLQRLFGRRSAPSVSELRTRREALRESIYGTRADDYGTRVVDLRSADEVAMEQRSHAEHERVAQQFGVSDLFAELTALVREDNSGFVNKTRIREIGQHLNERGGLKLMQEAYYYVRGAGAYFSQDIWHEIGEWRE